MEKQSARENELVLRSKSHAMAVINEMTQHYGVDQGRVISTRINHVRDLVTSGLSLSVVDWPDQFMAMGEATIRLIEAHFETVFDAKDVEAMGSLLEGKSKRYGPTPIRSWGPLGVIIRIDSKYQRFLHMIDNGDDGAGTDEPLLDTLRDILGYCVLGYALVNEKND